MKSLIYKILVAAGILLVSGTAFSQPLTADSIVMGPGYTNEVYYSLANGTIHESARNTWDIAFRTNIMSSSIITNDGSGVVLYTYPSADTSGWAAVDTTGISSWTPMFNDPDEWENGAFSRNALGHPDYGWGIYNQQTHNLTGDSIFIIKLRDGSFRKLWIMDKKSSQDVYEFRVADINGANENTVVLNLSGHSDVEFYGYDLENNTEVNFQAPKSEWDILFTRYMGINAGQPYPVVGVLSNNYLKVKQFDGVPRSFNEWWQGDWDTTRSVIGYDWKTFTGAGYEVNDSVVYFIANGNGDIYKLYFTKYEGSSTGKIVFNLGKVSGLGVANDPEASAAMSISPNPVKNRLNITWDGLKNGETISVINISGQKVLSTYASGTTTSVDVSSLSNGVYFVSLISDNKSVIKKFIISR